MWTSASTSLPKIAALISFCTYDFRLIEQTLKEAAQFADWIAVSVCDHFFNGTEENYALLEYLYANHPSFHFFEFAYDPLSLTQFFPISDPEHPETIHFWHNIGRLLLFVTLPPEIDYALFLDADEIPRGQAMAAWWKQQRGGQEKAIRFAAPWYFREARFQSATFYDTALLCQRRALESRMLWDVDERTGIFSQMPEPKKRNVVHEEIPLLDHYSWVKTKEEMLQKTRTWGHHWERDWTKLIEEEFSRYFSGRDFIRHYSYQEVPPLFDPLQVSVPLLPEVSLAQHRENISRFPHVHRMSLQDIFRLELRLLSS